MKTPKTDTIDSNAQAIATDITIYINDIKILASNVLFPIYLENNSIKLYLIGNKINGYAIITTKLYIINKIFGHTNVQYLLNVLSILSFS